MSSQQRYTRNLFLQITFHLQSVLDLHCSRLPVARVSSNAASHWQSACYVCVYEYVCFYKRICATCVFFISSINNTLPKMYQF